MFGFHARLFLVPKKNGNPSLVFNIKLLNCFIMAKGFKITTLNKVVCSLQQGDFVVALDLSDVYFHICIDLAFLQFLWFQFGGISISSGPCPLGSLQPLVPSLS